MKTNSPHSIIKKLPLFILSLCVVAFFQGCDNKSAGTANGAPQKKLRLAFVANTLDDFWSIVRLGCDVATRQRGFGFPLSRRAHRGVAGETFERPRRGRRGWHRHQSD